MNLARYIPNRVEGLLPPINGLPGAGSSAICTVDLPIGMRYHEVQMVFGGTAPDLGTEFSLLEVLINGKVAMNYNPADLDAENQFFGVSAYTANDILVLPFNRYRIKNQVFEEETAINTGSYIDETLKTGGISSLQIRFTFTAPVAAVNLTLYGTRTNALPGGAGAVPFVYKATYSISGATTGYPLTDFFKPGAVDRQALWLVSLVPSAGTLNNFYIKSQISGGQVIEFQRTDTLNRQIQTSSGCRIPQSGYYMLDKSERGYGSEVWDLTKMSSFEIDFDNSALATITVYYHSVGTI